MRLLRPFLLFLAFKKFRNRRAASTTRRRGLF